MDAWQWIFIGVIFTAIGTVASMVYFDKSPTQLIQELSGGKLLKHGVRIRSPFTYYITSSRGEGVMTDFKEQGQDEQGRPTTTIKLHNNKEISAQGEFNNIIDATNLGEFFHGQSSKVLRLKLKDLPERVREANEKQIRDNSLNNSLEETRMAMGNSEAMSKGVEGYVRARARVLGKMSPVGSSQPPHKSTNRRESYTEVKNNEGDLESGGEP